MDDLLIVASSCEVKAKMVAMITDLYPRHTQEDPATIILGMRVSRDRTNRTVTVHYEAVVSDTLQTHVPEWKVIFIEDLPTTPLPPSPRQLSKKDAPLYAFISRRYMLSE